MFSKFGHASLTLGLSLLALSNLSSAWTLEIFADSTCDGTPTAAPSGDGDADCAELTTSRRSFELSDVGNCIFTFYSSTDCADDTDENYYDAGEQGVCVPPDYTWSSFDVTGC